MSCNCTGLCCVGLELSWVGLFLIFVIITELMDDLTSETNKEPLYNLVNIMMLLFILAGISTYLNFIPMLAITIMSALLLLEALFLIRYYYVFLSKKEKYT